MTMVPAGVVPTPHAHRARFGESNGTSSIAALPYDDEHFRSALELVALLFWSRIAMMTFCWPMQERKSYSGTAGASWSVAHRHPCPRIGLRRPCGRADRHEFG